MHRKMPRGPGRRPLAQAAALSIGLLLVSGCQDSSCEAPAPPSLTSLRLTVEGRRLLDVEGREVLLRGVNAGGRSKLDPFFPFPFAESGRPEQAGAPPFEEAAAAYAARLGSWGINFVRLPFVWEAVEPARGSYDATFLGRYQALAEAFGQQGVRVLVDAHQDVFARAYCGDGFPPWACPEPLPEPPADCSGWFRGYLGQDPAMAAAFDRFWAGEDGLMDAFEDLWRHVAGALWAVDAVIGFEILNEPYPGTADERTWAAAVLVPFYERLAAALREVAPGALVFFDATGLSATTTRTSLPRPAGEGLVFAPHYYAMSAFVEGFPHDPDAIHTDLGRWADKGAEWALPVLVGEFGIKPLAEDASAYLRLTYDALDAHRLHSAQWEASTTADDWNDEAMSVVDPSGADTALVDVLARPYPRAVAGTLTAFVFDADTGEATLAYDAEAGGLTEVVVPLRRYPQGVRVSLGGVPGCAADLGAGLVVVRADRAGPAVLELRPR